MTSLAPAIVPSRHTRLASIVLAVVAGMGIGWIIISLHGGCATVQPTVTKIEHIVSCDLADIKSQLPSLVDPAATCLLSPAYAICLGKLVVGVVTDDTIVCAVRIASGEASARMATGTQPNAQTIKANGDAYLAARGVKFAN